MGISDIWWLDVWGAMALFMTIFGLFFALIGLMMVAVEGRKGWSEGLTFVVVAFPLAGILFPLLVVALPVVAIYRAVRNV